MSHGSWSLLQKQNSLNVGASHVQLGAFTGGRGKKLIRHDEHFSGAVFKSEVRVYGDWGAIFCQLK